MTYYSPIIVVVAFSRPQALQRSLFAINDAYYRSPVKLVISVDGGGPREVLEVAESFEFQHGDKRVIKRRENLGLKKHILACGDLSESAGSIIILEDDIVADKYFYLYAQDALNYYAGSTLIGGVSLYSPEYNEYSGLPFSPLLSEYDTYFMQIPCSWGQAWTYDQWNQFRIWMEGSADCDFESMFNIPEYVKKWKASSWKKHFALYLAQKGKYFVYPYVSLTTNVSDPGGFHNITGSNIVQVSLASKLRKFRDFRFLPLDGDGVKYDAFMENCSDSILDFIKDSCSIEGSLCLDLYDLKSLSLLNEFDYCITRKPTKASLRRYGLDYRPAENNFLFENSFGESHVCFALTRPQDISSSRARLASNSLMYWAGFNFLARKYLVGNLKHLCRRLWCRL